MDELSTLLQTLPGYSLISVGMKQAALDGARIPDSSGMWPGEVGYLVTYDVYFAALSLLGFMQAQPVVRQTSSEGTSVTVDPPSWGTLAAYFRTLSVILSQSDKSIISVVPIPGRPHVYRTEMRGGSNDVDTDVS